MSMLKRVIRTAVISALGAKLARGRSPLIAALLMLLATRALSGREEPAETIKTGSDADPRCPATTCCRNSRVCCRNY